MTKQKKFRVLLTGAGAPGTSGTIFSLREGAHSEGVKLELVGADMTPENIVGGDLFSTEQLPSPESPDYVTQLKSVTQTKGIDLIVPQTTRENLVLSQAITNQDLCPTLVSERQSVEAANDKLLVTELFEEFALGAPKYRSAHSIVSLQEAAQDLGYPEKDIVVKITSGNGGRGVRLVTMRSETYGTFLNEKPQGIKVKLEDLIATLTNVEHFPTLLVSEALSEPEISVDVYSGVSGFVAVPRYRDKIRSGISMQTRIFHDEGLSDRIRVASEKLGLTGAFGFQFMTKGEEFLVIECNPRIQGTMVASLMSGNNIIWLAARDALGLQPKLNLNHKWADGVFSRTWGGELRWADKVARL